MNAVVSMGVVSPERQRIYEIFKARAEALARLRANPQKLASLRVYYHDHPADMINDWGVTVDPRVPVGGADAAMPFILDPKQREWLDWTHEGFLAQQYGGTEKSRDVGLSWLLVGYSVSLCVTWRGISIGWGSFSAIKVDKRGELGSLFEKGREYLRWLPPDLRAGYEEADPECCKEMLLKFPGTGSTIFGEIGDKIGRGNRAAIYFVDEAAFLEHDMDVDGALSKTTKCRQDVSTVRGMENTFAERMHKPGIRKFTYHWRDNPRMTQAEYDAFFDLYGPVITAQELDINYQASVEGVVIPAEWINSCIDAHVKLGIEPSGIKAAAFDVADLGIDKNAFASRHGILLTHAEQWSGESTGDILRSVQRVFRLCDDWRCESFVYDADGPGAGVLGDARHTNEQRQLERMRVLKVEPFRGSGKVFDPTRQMVEGRKNEDFFANAKAQAWWHLRILANYTYRAVKGREKDPGFDFDADRILSIDSTIPELARLIMELSQPVYTQNTAGKLLIDKAPEGRASPNLADAVMMLFAPRRKPMRIRDSVFDAQEF